MAQNQNSAIEVCENEMMIVQNQSCSDEESGENQSNSDEIGENQWSDDELGDHQNSDEETGEDQNSVEDTGDENNDEETGENYSSDEEWLEGGKICILSDPTHPHKICRQDNQETNQNCFSCGERKLSWQPALWKFFHYYCTICQVEFHRNCLEYPSKMNHPYHPQHPLIFTCLDKDSGIIYETNFVEYYRFINSRSIVFKKNSERVSGSNIIFDNCNWCGDDLCEWFYRCLICNFSLDLHCARKIPPPTIQNPKSHQHPLSLFPWPITFPCNACGLVGAFEPGYACYQCKYVVHHSCISLPRVIKLTRHPHRISHTPFLPTQVSSCRVCYQNVDIKYGQYSCNLGDCTFVIHSKCATDDREWDGKELEWEPEDSEETKDVSPYKKVGDGLIEHFCHDHHYLKLQKHDVKRDSGKQCQACMRYITFDDFYNCIECDFFLHEVCANLPRQLDHALHRHSLFLDPYNLRRRDFGKLKCYLCSRVSSGWTYICKEEGCMRGNLPIDVNCILPECFTHESHAQHPLFIYFGRHDELICKGCKKDVYGYTLRCTKCDFELCYECSTIPKEIYYKYDEHPLSLCYGESGVDEIYWCEVCENKLDPTEWFYTNKDSCTTIHLNCLFGDTAHMKSGQIINFASYEVEVVTNCSSRPICRVCQRHCPHPVYFKIYMLDGTVTYFCSFACLWCM